MESQRDPPRELTRRGARRARVKMWGTRGGAASVAASKAWVKESRLQRCPSQQAPWRSMAVQGLVVPMVVQEGLWQVLMYTGTEKLPAGGSGEGSEPERQLHLSLHPRGRGQCHVSVLRLT